MKLSYLRSSRRSGFTLVELLVVIAIIAVLASVTLVGVSAALAAAKRAKANSTASQLQAAVLNYYTEYGVYPIPTGTAAGDYVIKDAQGNDADWGNLVCALSGNINPSTGKPVTGDPVPNTRAIAYLTFKSSDVDAAGTPKNPLPTGASIFFNIAMDADYDGVLGAAPSTAALPNFATAQAGVDLTGTSGGSSTAGVAVWANCNGSTSSKNPSFWVHTY